MAAPTLEKITDEKVKYTTPEQLESYAPMLEQEFVKKDKNPEGYVFKTVNLLPSFKGAVHTESVMQFYVVKYKVGKDKALKRELQSIEDQSDSEGAFHIDCEKFLQGWKRAA